MRRLLCSLLALAAMMAGAPARAAFDPSAIPNLVVRFAPSVSGAYTDGSASTAGTTAVTDGSTIQTLVDSASGYIAYEGTNKPTYQVVGSHLGAPDMLFTAASGTTLSFGHPAALENLAFSGYTIVIPAYVGTGSISAVFDKGALGGDAANALIITGGIFERYFTGTPLTGPGYPTSPAAVGAGSKHIFVYRYTPIASGGYVAPVIREEIFVDGRQALNRIAQAPQWLSGGNWRIGSSDSAGYSFFGEIGEVDMYARSITDTELQQVTAYEAQRYAIPCYSPMTQPRPEAITTNVFCVGNSLTYGVTGASTPVDPYPTQLSRLLLGYNTQIWNLGISGQSTTALISYSSQREQLFFDPQRNNIAIVWELTNDYTATNNTPAQAYANLVTLCTSLKNAGFRVIPVTMIVRGGGYTNPAITSAGTTTQQQAAAEAGRQTINNLIRADFANGPSSYGDMLLDFGNGGVITLNGQSFDTSPLGTFSNLTFFGVDTIHLTQAGYKVVATGAALAVQQEMQTLSSGQLFGADHTKIASDATAALAAQGVTSGRLAKLDGMLYDTNSYLLTHAKANDDKTGYGLSGAEETAIVNNWMTRNLGHSMTAGQLLVLLQARNAASVTNTWSGTLHQLVTAYTLAGDGAPVLTDTTPYSLTTITAPPVQSRSTAVGTVPQP